MGENLMVKRRIVGKKTLQRLWESKPEQSKNLMDRNQSIPLAISTVVRTFRI
jgi:hypothetical protein